VFAVSAPQILRQNAKASRFVIARGKPVGYTLKFAMRLWNPLGGGATVFKPAWLGGRFRFPKRSINKEN